MKCPHCRVTIHANFNNTLNGNCGKNILSYQYYWTTSLAECPSCHEAIVLITRETLDQAYPRSSKLDEKKVWQAYPQHSVREKASPEVPNDLSVDFNEACLVLEISPKSSAALSRRCLQNLLRLQGFTQKDLAPAIEALLKAGNLPSHLAQSVDSIRNIGNFSAHTMKDTNTGQILPVEPHEAEWNLDVLEGLFDFYYVAPAKEQAKRAALNAKLATVPKPPMKQ